MNIKPTDRGPLRVGTFLYPERVPALPATRGDCAKGPRPCPFVRCRHHLYVDVNPHSGSLKLNHDVEVWEMEESCSLDVADRRGETLETVADILNLGRERVRQIENAAVRHLHDADEAGILAELLDQFREMS